MKADNDEELLKVLDEEGNDTKEFQTREYIHDKKLFHNEVSVFIINGNNILLEQRSKHKKIHPGKLCVPGVM